MATPEVEKMVMYDDLLDLLCGNLIGRSQKRTVFECALMPGYVVKVETELESTRNIEEFKVWSEVQHTPHSKWFAQVHSMSQSGRLLIMERTVVPGPDQWPDKVPAYLADFKRENYGISMLTDPKTGKRGYQFVAHDYSHHHLVERGLTKRMQSVNWDDQ